MHRRIWITILATCSLAFVRGQGVGLEVLAAEVQIDFPDQIVFSLQAKSDVEVDVVELEYGLARRACTADVNRVVPEDFEVDVVVNTSWTWNMRRTGSLPPGARLWWRWRLVDSAGREVWTETRWLTWLDDVHPWRTLTVDDLALHWYVGSETFAQTLMDAAVGSRTRLEADIGARPEDEIQIYIYATTEDMRQAVLFEPGWTGALAFPSYGIVIIGINQRNIDWGLDTIAHELAHVIVGDVVSHCYSGLPTWLDEGLAVYAEGELDPSSQMILEEAIVEDLLFSIRSLSDGFTEHAHRAYLSYAQSYSIVAYLINTYGQEKMLDLLDAFQAGYRYDNALVQVYGFDADGLEVEWRDAVGALPMAVSPEEIEPTPTVFPTIQPYSDPSVAAATPMPASSTAPTPAGSEGYEGSPSYLTLLLGLWLIMTVGFLILIFMLRRIGSYMEDDTDGRDAPTQHR